MLRCFGASIRCFDVAHCPNCTVDSFTFDGFGNLCRSVSQFVNLAGLREDETWTAPWAVHARRELFSRQSWRKIGELRISGLVRCICKMCKLYVHSAYHYIKTQQAKGNVEMTDDRLPKDGPLVLAFGLPMLLLGLAVNSNKRISLQFWQRRNCIGVR